MMTETNEKGHHHHVNDKRHLSAAGPGSSGPSTQDINNCIMRERRLFMQTHLRMSKLKVDVSYSQSVVRQHKIYQNIPVLLGSMQGLLMTIFAVVASIFRMTPCMKAQQKKSEALHKELQLAYVGAAHPENGTNVVTTKMENSNDTTKVSKYVVPGNNSEIERKLRSLEKQIQQLRNNEVLMKVTDLD